MDGNALLQILGEGNTRSNRIVVEIMPQILADETLISTLVQGCQAENPYLRLHCSDALEQVSASKPEWVQPYKQTLLNDISKVRQQEVQWQLAQILPRLNLSESESKAAFDYFLDCFNKTDSRITMALMLEAMVIFGQRFPERFAYEANRLLSQSLHSPIPALSARARKLHKLAKKPKHLPDPFTRK